MKRQSPPAIRNRGSLLTYEDHGVERCLGYLFEFRGHGLYEPTFGKLDVGADEARTHNQLLSQAEIKGLDENCAVGLGGRFYTRKAERQTIVVTWLGEVVSQDVQIRGQVLAFRRQAMTFRGRLRRNEDAFGFKRIQ